MLWKFADGTTFTLCGCKREDGSAVGHVDMRSEFGPPSKLRHRLRADLFRLREYAGAVRIDVTAPPGGDVGLDLDVPWLVDAWLRQRGEAYAVALECGPDIGIDDAPPHVRALLADRAADEELDGGDGRDDVIF